MDRYSPSGLKVHDYEIVSIGLAANIDRLATFDKKEFEEIKEINLLDIS